METYTATSDVTSQGGHMTPPGAGLTSDALPEAQSTISAESSQAGVSTRNVLSPNVPAQKKPKDNMHWYALRATYGREGKTNDYLRGKNIETFYPTLKTVKLIDGKRVTREESRIPNIFFARGTEEEIKSYVYDNVNLPYLRFYYAHKHVEGKVIKEPLVIPDSQMNSLKIICAADSEDIIASPPHHHHQIQGRPASPHHRRQIQRRSRHRSPLPQPAKGRHHHRRPHDSLHRLCAWRVFRGCW